MNNLPTTSTVTDPSESFVHLHVHSAFSLLDGFQDIAAMVTKAKSDGMAALAVTDHGSLGGTWKFAHEARRQGIKPILGIESYLSVGGVDRFNPTTIEIENDMDVDGGDTAKTLGRKTKRYEHLTILAASEQGWRNLVRINNESQNSFYNKPLMDFELIKAHSEGLIVLTGCLGGPVAGPLARGDHDLARHGLEQIIDAVGAENVYVEMMYHHIPAEKSIMRDLRDLADEYGLEVVVTGDCHYTHAEDSVTHEVWLADQSGRTLDDPKAFRFNGSGYHLMSPAEIRGLFPKSRTWQRGCDNTVAIADRVADWVLPEERIRLPKFPLTPAGVSEADYLRELVEAGAERKYGSITDEIADRIDFELNIINDMGYPAYFLIVWEMIGWARNNNILVGPGRGSAAGAITAYALDITDIEPLSQGLLFERFLEPGRVGMPDIDTDFEQARIPDILTHLRDLYGHDHVAQLGTFAFTRTKAALKNSAKVLGNSALGQRMSNLVPSVGGKPIPFKTLLQPADAKDAGFGEALRQLVDPEDTSSYADEARDVLRHAVAMEDMVRNWGIHACGVIVSAEPLLDLVPMRKLAPVAADTVSQEEKPWITVWDGPDCEQLGLLKLDALSLRNLDIARLAVQLIADDTGTVVDLYDLDPDDVDDPKVNAAYTMLGEGRTAGTFQLEASGMTDLTVDVQPHGLDDLTALGALYRPGPMAAGSHTSYAARKRGDELVRYKNLVANRAEAAVIDSVLGDTYGLCVSGETPVYSVDQGREVPIRDIAVGERVQSFNEAAGRYEPAAVTFKVRTGIKDTIVTRFRGGMQVRSTPEHQFLTTDGWKRADELTVDDSVATPWQLIADDGADVPGTDWAGVEGQEPAGLDEVFDITVEGNHNFVGGGVVLHNCVYQEQIMRLAGVVAGFDAKERSKLRKAMGKKDPAAMAESNKLFYERGTKEIVLEDGTVSIAFEQASIDNLLDMIRGAGSYLFNKCVTGDTVVLTGKPTEWTVRDLYQRLHGNPDAADGVCAHCGAEEPTGKTICRTCRSWLGMVRGPRGLRLLAHESDGRIRPQLMKDVHYQGKQKVYEIRTRAGRTVKATANHRFLTEDGYRRVDEMIQGATAIVSHEGYEPQGSQTMYRTTVGPRLKRAGNKPWLPAELNSGFVDGGFTKLKTWKKTTTKACVQCGATQGRLEAAHLDGDRTHNEPSNLAWMCVSHHKAYDYATNGRNRRWDKGHLSGYDIVDSITFVGEEDTYDVEMADGTDHNFIANGLVSHNSHAAAYGKVTFWTAWLKANYPAHFAAATLAVTKDPDRRAAALNSLAKDGVTLLPPDVNSGRVDTHVVDAATIRLGLAEIGQMQSAAERIASVRNTDGPFTSLADLSQNVVVDLLRVTRLSTSQLVGLIESGACDSLTDTSAGVAAARARMIAELHAPAAGLEVDWSWSVLEAASRQRDRIGLALGEHPMLHHADDLAQFRVPAVDEAGAERHWSRTMRVGQMLDRVDEPGRGPLETATVMGVLVGWATRPYSKGTMANWVLEDADGRTLSGAMFDRDLRTLREVPTVGQIVTLHGRVNVKTVKHMVATEDGDEVEVESRRVEVVADHVWTVPVGASPAAAAPAAPKLPWGHLRALAESWV